MNKQLLNTRVLKSSIDQSVNWISNYGKGSVETRYVRREAKKVIGYVTSHSGCKMGCRQCFLTQQGQISFDHVTPEVYGEQLKFVLNHYGELVAAGGDKAESLNINFMARGEPLANKYVINNFTEIFKQFDVLSKKFDLTPKVNISTIYPHVAAGRKLSEIFAGMPVHMYYSMYTHNIDFRELWMPNAAPIHVALESMKEYEESRIDLNYPVTFHWALIKNHNDNIVDVKITARILKSYQFRSKFNLVRYNPHPNTGSEESDKINEIFNIISDAVGSERSYIVPRVGKDIAASCGMFIEE